MLARIYPRRCGCFLLALLFCCCSCVNGPARMQLNGKLRYLTAETVRQCPWYHCLYGVPAAALTDLGIIAADTLLVPVDMFCKSPYGTSEDPALLWIFWLPFYPVVCALSPFFAYQEQPDNGALYRWLWGFNYLDSVNGTLQLIEVAAPLGRKTKLTCNRQLVSEVYGRIELLASSQDQLVVLTQPGRLYWWTRTETGWKLKPQEYVPGSDALLEFASHNRLNPKSHWFKVSDETWRLLQELAEQMPVDHCFGNILKFSTNQELFYELHLTCPAGSIWVSCKIIPGEEKPQIYYLQKERMYHGWR